MRKIIILTLIVLLTACNASTHQIQEDTYFDETKIISKDKVEFLVTEVKDNKVSYIIINHTEDSYLYGADYAVQVKVNNKYQTIKPKEGFEFPTVGYELKAKESVTNTITPLQYVESLAPGTYRLLKSIIDDQQKLNYMVVEFVWP